MTITEGKDFIRDCMSKSKCSSRFEDCFIYTYGNQKDIQRYQVDPIVANITLKGQHQKAKFIIKCFLHPELYVVWYKKDGEGNGKYPIAKNHLLDIENHRNEYRAVSWGTNYTAYLFCRNEDIVIKFIDEVVKKEVENHV